MLSTYPQPVVERAVDPAEGIPANVKFLNLAEIKTHLDAWRLEYLKHMERVERAARHRLAAPEPESPEMRERVGRMFADLSAQLRANR